MCAFLRFFLLPEQLSKGAGEMKKMDGSRSRQGKGEVQVGSIMQSLPSRTQVFLIEWWLVNANGKGLAIGGFAHRDSERVSLFCSAPIVKRHDTTTFETADGMTIMVGGLINQLRTLENGFSLKVCKKFLLGFPYDWAEYSTSCYGEDSSVQAGSVKATASEKTDSQSRSTINYFEATSLDDVTVPKLRDLFSLSDPDDTFLMKKIYDDVVDMLGSGAEYDGEFLRSSRKTSLGAAAKSQIEAQINKKKSKEDGLCKYNEDILSARKIVKKVNHKSGHQSRAVTYVRRRREGVSTRSMTMLKK